MEYNEAYCNSTFKHGMYYIRFTSYEFIYILYFWVLASDFHFHDHFTDSRTLRREVSSSQGLYLKYRGSPYL